MSLTKCKKCGKKINDNVKKCPYCYTKERNNKVMPIIIDVLKVNSWKFRRMAFVESNNLCYR